MLRHLRIEHLAVIDGLQVEFEPGLNVLTGETGAGKSMLVEAVALLVGGRASADLVRTGESQTTVQAIFDAAPANRRGPTPEPSEPEELIVRREITAQGRSRAFVDDTLVTAAALKDRISPLAELHGQHEHQTLLDPGSHLAMLDEFAGLEAARQGVSDAFHGWRRLRSELDALQLDERERAARVDLLRFQVAELEQARLRSGEDATLETSRRVLANADRLQRLCGEAYGALYDSDEAALARLGTVWKRVVELAAVDPVFRPYAEARDGIKSQLDDLAHALRSYRESLDVSPAALQEVEDRLALLDRLKRKYGPTLSDVLARKGELALQLDALQNADARRASLEAGTLEARSRFLAEARALSRTRRDASKAFSQQLRRLLGELAMGHTQFEVRFEAELGESAWTESGVDAAECYLSANPGEDPRPLARIASGGELSRVMLAIRTLSAADTPGKTLIFDEIDAGISGRVADVVGKQLRRLGESFQVLCITHLPQIAAAGHAHFRILKTVKNGRTQTRVDRLGPAERIDELARMMGGSTVSGAARAAARELLGESEIKTKGESERPAPARK